MVETCLVACSMRNAVHACYHITEYARHKGMVQVCTCYCLVSCMLAAGSYFALSLFDRMWHPDLTEDEAIAMMEVWTG